MYLSHYNLAKKPFQLTTDPEFLWLGEKHKEAFATLKYAILENKGVLALTGDVGTGKTTLINALIRSLEEDKVAATIYDPSLEVLEFFNLVATGFNMGKTFESKGAFITDFRQFLQKAHERKQKVLLIIDEAQSLSKKLLENIRLLSNIELPNDKLINIFFVGQNEFNQTLASQECRALRQRIMLTYNIRPLSGIEIFGYIKYRLKVAGTEIKLFNRKAIQEVYRFSNGYPRLINTICDHALLTGYVRKLNKITPAIIMECSHELNLSGEIKKNIFSNVLYPSSYYGHSSHLVKPPFENEMSMEMEVPTNQDLRAIHFRKAERTEKSVDLKEYNKGNITKDFKDIIIGSMRQKLLLWASAVSSKQKRIFVFGSAVTLAVIFMLLTVLSNKVISSKRDRQKQSTPPLASPSSSSSETGNHFIPSTFHNKGKTATGNPKEDTTGSESKTLILTELMLAKMELNNKNYVRAAELFEDIIARNPANMTEVKAYYSQALRGQAVKYIGKQPDMAEILLRKAVETDPQNAQAHFDLGKLYTRSKNWAKAIKGYQKAAALNYRTSDAFYNLGFIYASIEDFSNAEKMFLHVVDLKPPYIDKALFNLAAVQQKQGKQNECIKNLEKALINNPKNQRVQQYLNQLKKENGVS